MLKSVMKLVKLQNVHQGEPNTCCRGVHPSTEEGPAEIDGGEDDVGCEKSMQSETINIRTVPPPNNDNIISAPTAGEMDEGKIPAPAPLTTDVEIEDDSCCTMCLLVHSS